MSGGTFCTGDILPSDTRAHTGPGPGEFLSALVNHLKSAYLNHNSIRNLLYINLSRGIKLPMPLIYDFSFFACQLQHHI